MTALPWKGPRQRHCPSKTPRRNLVIRARESLPRGRAVRGPCPPDPVHITLDKRLPVASGIGGGSADAAATLRLLCDLWDFRPAPEDLSRIALGLRRGCADVA